MKNFTDKLGTVLRYGIWNFIIPYINVIIIAGMNSVFEWRLTLDQLLLAIILMYVFSFNRHILKIEFPEEYK